MSMSRTPPVHLAPALPKGPFHDLGKSPTPNGLGWALALASLVCGVTAVGCGNDAPPAPPSLQTSSGGSATSGATSTGSGSTTSSSTGSSGVGTATNGVDTSGGSAGTTTGGSASSSGETT